jgi:hypothetical protein
LTLHQRFLFLDDLRFQFSQRAKTAGGKAGLSRKSQQSPVITFYVEDAENNHPVAFDAVKNLVGKTPGQQAAKAVVVNRTAFGVFRKLPNGLSDFVQ